jgi:hypothetical protein
MASGGEDPTLWQIAAGAVGKAAVGISLGLVSLIGWAYRRLEQRDQAQAEQIRAVTERLDSHEERIRDAPSREEMDRKLDRIHDDIRGVHTRLDQLLQDRSK